MNSEVLELEVHRNQQGLALSQSAQNCSISGQAQLAQCAQSMIGIAGTPYWACTCSSLGDYEISIHQIGHGEPLLNYGPKLRLLMADPYKGVELRDAIAKLKTALKEVIEK
jgi:hypothetical protein